jgi:hypothetical protein
VARGNWFLKHQYALSAETLAELSQDRLKTSVPRPAQLRNFLQQDQMYWHGWYARNNGAIEFLGDHTAGESGWGTAILSCLLLILMCGIVLAMLKQAMPALPGQAVEPWDFPKQEVRKTGGLES